MLASPVKARQRLLYRCSLLRRFVGVVEGTRDRVVLSYTPDHSSRDIMLVISWNQSMKSSERLLENFGKRLDDGAFSARDRCCSFSVAVAIKVWEATDDWRLVIDDVRVVMRLEF